MKQSAAWLIIRGRQFVVEADGLHIIRSSWDELTCLHNHRSEIIPLGHFHNMPLYMVDIGLATIPPQYIGVDLKSLALGLGEQWFGRLCQAWQYALFLRTHRYCGQCGASMTRVSEEMAMHCHSCQHRCYPRISPCIIVAIKRQRQILLAHGRNHPQGTYSILAGFVESGETLEQAVHREIGEEVGIKVDNLRYFNSQPWPFPHSLMVGFLADYESGEVEVDGVEILDAKWFAPNALPPIPPSFSIAGQLIQKTLTDIATENF